MSHRRRGFAAINAKPAVQENHVPENEKIEALESRLVKQFETAIRLITSGDRKAARNILQQLLREPLLVQQATAAGELHALLCNADVSWGAATTAAAATAPAGALQSRALQGMRYKVLYNLAPLLGNTQEALEVWCAALAHSPRNAKIWEEASIILAHLGRLNVAAYAAHTAVGLAPDSVLLLERLIILLAAMCDWDGAGQMLLQLARVTGGCHQWLIGLAKVAPKLKGFTEDDVKNCITDCQDHVQYISQQAQQYEQQEAAQQKQQEQLPEQSVREFLGVAETNTAAHDDTMQQQDQQAVPSAASDTGVSRGAVEPVRTHTHELEQSIHGGSLVVLQADSIEQLLRDLLELLSRQYVELIQGGGVDSNVAVGEQAVLAAKSNSVAAKSSTTTTAAIVTPTVAVGPTDRNGLKCNILPLRQLRVALRQQILAPAVALPPPRAAALAQQSAGAITTAPASSERVAMQDAAPALSEQHMAAAAHAVDHMAMPETEAAVIGHPGYTSASTLAEAPGARSAATSDAVTGMQDAVGAQECTAPHYAATSSQPQQQPLAQLQQQGAQVTSRLLADGSRQTVFAPLAECQQAAGVAGGQIALAVATGAGSVKLHCARRPPTGAAAASGKSRPSSKLSKMGHVKQHVIQPLQLVQATVGKWLPATAAAAAGSSIQASSISGAVVSNVQQCQQPLQLQHTSDMTQQPSTGESDAQVVTQGSVAQSWHNAEQQLLKHLSQQAPTLPLQLAKQLLSHLLSAAEQVQLPVEVAGLLLQLSAYVSARQLTSQQHLVLAELYLDAALAVRDTGVLPAHLGGSAVAVQTIAEAVSGPLSSAAAASGGVRRVQSASRKRPSPAAGADAAPAAEGVAVAAGQQGTADAAGADTHGDSTDAMAGGTAKRARIVRPRKQLQGSAVAGVVESDVAAAGAASGGPGSRLAQRQQAEARQQMLDRHVQQLMESCERHLHECDIARACEDMLRPAQRPPDALQISESQYHIRGSYEHVGSSAAGDFWGASNADGLTGFTILKSVWWQQMQEAQQQVEHALQQQQVQHSSNNTHQPQQEEAWWMIAACNQELSQPRAVQQASITAVADVPGGSRHISPSSTSSNTSPRGFWGASVANWQRMLAAQQQQAVSKAAEDASILGEEWGPVIRLPGAAMHAAGKLFWTAAATAGGEASARQSTENLDSEQAARMLALWRSSAWLQQSDMQSWQPSSLQQIRSTVSINEQPGFADLAAAEPALQVSDQDDATTVRRWWALTRLYQARGDELDNLHAADAAGKQCLAWFERKSKQQQMLVGRVSAATSAPQQQQQAQEVGIVQLPSCRYDAVISKPVVDNMLDTMWLTMQVKAATQEQLPHIEQMLVSLQQQQQQQHQASLQRAATGQQQLESGQLQQYEDQADQAMADQQPPQNCVECAKKVQELADGVVAMLKKRCLVVVAGDLSAQQLCGIAVIQKAASYAAAAATTALNILQLQPHPTEAQVSRTSHDITALPAMQQQHLVQQQAAKQKFVLLELQCILLQLQHWLRLHCQHSTSTAAAKSSKGAAALSSGSGGVQSQQKHGRTSSMSGGSKQQLHHGGNSSATQVDKELKVKLEEFSKCWQCCTSHTTPGPAAVSAKAAADLGTGRHSGPAQQQQQHKQTTVAVPRNAPASGVAPAGGAVQEPQSTDVDMEDVATAQEHAGSKCLAPAADGIGTTSAKHQQQQQQQQQEQDTQAMEVDEAAAAEAAERQAEADTARRQQLREQQEAAALQAAAEALAAAKAAEQVQQGEQLLLQQLEQSPDVLMLLGQVQQSLLQLLAAHSPAVPVSLVGAAASSSTAAVAAASGMATAASKRASASKRHRTPSAVIIDAAAAAPVPAAAGAAAATRRTATTAPGAGDHNVRHRDLSTRSNKDKTLLLEAAVAVLAAHELNPVVSGDASSLLGLMEGLYSILSLKFSAVAEVEKFLRLAKDRLLLIFWKLQHSQTQEHTQQVQQQTAQNQQDMLSAVDRALGQLFFDLHGIDVPWRAEAFGKGPLVRIIAATAATAAAGASSLDAGGVDSTAIASGASPAAIAAAAVKAVDAILAKATPAAKVSHQQQHSESHQQHDSSKEADVQHSVFQPRFEGLDSGCSLVDLMKIWRYVAVRASPTEISDNPRANGTYAQADNGLRVLLATATTAVAAANVALPAAVPDAGRGTGAPGGTTVSAAAVSAKDPEQTASITMHHDQPQQQAGFSADDHAATEAGHGTSSSSEDSTSTDDEDESSEEDEQTQPSTAAGMEQQFWQPLAPFLMLLKEKLPGPPAALMTAATARLSRFLDATAAAGNTANSLAQIAEHAAAAGCTDNTSVQQWNCSSAATNVYGWSDHDVQLVLSLQQSPLPLSTSALAGLCQDWADMSGPTAAELLAADPLLEVHALLYHAAACEQPRWICDADNVDEDHDLDLSQFASEGCGDAVLLEVQKQEEQLLLDLAVRPDGADTWMRLAELYLYIMDKQHGLLEQAAGVASVSEWRASAAVAASHRPSSAAMAASTAGGRSASPELRKHLRRQQLQVLQRYGRRALRATVIAVQLLRQQQRDAGDCEIMATCLDNLGVLLRDAALCLAPWYEPWRHRPAGAGLRQQLLLAAQACFTQAEDGSSEWQFPCVLGQTAAKLKQPGWQAYCLRQFARACWLSRSEAHCGAAYLQPYVKLHGFRFKLLLAALGLRKARRDAAAAADTVATDACGGSSEQSVGQLNSLQDTLQLVSQWCFDDEHQHQLQPLLQQLQQNFAEHNILPGTQQHIMQQLRLALCKQQVQDDASNNSDVQVLLQPLLQAVELLIQDCSSALQFCQDCYTKPLGPARYSLAAALYYMGRLDHAASQLAPLFVMSGPSRSCSCPVSIDILPVDGHIKAVYQPSKHELQQLRKQRKRQRLQQQEQAEHQLPQSDVDMLDACPASKAAAAAAPAGLVPADESRWGAMPPSVRGWGGDESQRQWNARTRRALLLYMRVLVAKQDLDMLVQVRQGLMGTVGFINDIADEGLRPKDLGALAAGLQLQLMWARLAPVLQQYCLTLQRQQAAIAAAGPTGGHAAAPSVAAGAALQPAGAGLSRQESAPFTVMPVAAAAAARLSGTDGAAVQPGLAGPSRQPDPPGVEVIAASHVGMQMSAIFKLHMATDGGGVDTDKNVLVFLEFLANQPQQLTAGEAAAAGSPEMLQAASQGADQLGQAAFGAQLQLLEHSFQLYIDYLYVALEPKEQTLKLGELMAAAAEFVRETAAATAAPALVGSASFAAPIAATQTAGNELTVVSTGLPSTLPNQDAEHLLQYLAYAHLCAVLHQQQQLQPPEADRKSQASLSAAAERLRGVAKLLKQTFNKAQNLKTGPTSLHNYTSQVLLLYRTVARLVWESQQRMVAACEAAVAQQFKYAQWPELQPLQVAQQQPQDQYAAAAASRGASPAPAAAGTDTEPADAVTADDKGSLAGQQIDGNDATADSGPSSRATTPVPPSPAAAAGADTPTGAEAAGGTTATATPMGTAATTPTGSAAAATPIGATPAEGRRARRAAKAGQEQAAAGGNTAAAGKLAVVFDDVHRVAAVEAVLPVLKSTQDLVKANVGSYLLDGAEGKQYTRNVYCLVCQLVKLGARSAGLPVTVVAPGADSQPTTEKAAVAALQSSYICLSDLLKGKASRTAVEDSLAAVARATAADQREQQRQHLPPPQHPSALQQLLQQPPSKQQQQPPNIVGAVSNARLTACVSEPQLQHLPHLLRLYCPHLPADLQLCLLQLPANTLTALQEVVIGTQPSSMRLAQLQQSLRVLKQNRAEEQQMQQRMQQVLAPAPQQQQTLSPIQNASIVMQQLQQCSMVPPVGQSLQQQLAGMQPQHAFLDLRSAAEQQQQQQQQARPQQQYSVPLRLPSLQQQQHPQLLHVMPSDAAQQTTAHGAQGPSQTVAALEGGATKTAPQAPALHAGAGTAGQAAAAIAAIGSAFAGGVGSASPAAHSDGQHGSPPGAAAADPVAVAAAAEPASAQQAAPANVRLPNAQHAAAAMLIRHMSTGHQQRHGSSTQGVVQLPTPETTTPGSSVQSCSAAMTVAATSAPTAVGGVPVLNITMQQGENPEAAVAPAGLTVTTTGAAGQQKAQASGAAVQIQEQQNQQAPSRVFQSIAEMAQRAARTSGSFE